MRQKRRELPTTDTHRHEVLVVSQLANNEPIEGVGDGIQPVHPYPSFGYQRLRLVESLQQAPPGRHSREQRAAGSVPRWPSAAAMPAFPAAAALKQGGGCQQPRCHSRRTGPTRLWQRVGSRLRGAAARVSGRLLGGQLHCAVQQVHCAVQQGSLVTAAAAAGSQPSTHHT